MTDENRPNIQNRRREEHERQLVVSLRRATRHWDESNRIIARGGQRMSSEQREQQVKKMQATPPRTEWVEFFITLFRSSDKDLERVVKSFDRPKRRRATGPASTPFKEKRKR